MSKQNKLVLLAVSLLMLNACGQEAQLATTPSLNENTSLNSKDVTQSPGNLNQSDLDLSTSSEIRGRRNRPPQMAPSATPRPTPMPRPETPGSIGAPSVDVMAPESPAVPPTSPAPPQAQAPQSPAPPQAQAPQSPAPPPASPVIPEPPASVQPPAPAAPPADQASAQAPERPPRRPRRGRGRGGDQPPPPPSPPGPPPEPTPNPVPVPTPTPLPTPSLDPAQAQIALGARLFFEPRLSGDNSMSCATCHDPAQGFSNGESTAAGITGARGNRNTPTIYEVSAQTLTFWDGRASTLEEQALGPIENPIEMNDTLPNVIAKLSADPSYVNDFNVAFGTGPSADGIARAIASFERAVEVDTTPFERFQNGEVGAMSQQQVRGMNLFFSNRTNCTICHNGPSFTDQRFLNIGVNFNVPNPDLGRFNVTGNNADRGAFKVPTLINVAQTAPYMHDGSLPNLQAVVAHYNRGGDPNPNNRLRPLGLNQAEQADLVAFLEALSAGDNVAQLRALGAS